jgi:hypothetical protein
VSASLTPREREIADPVGTGATNRAPLFHVKRGDPTPEELAALTAVLAAEARAATAARSARRAAGPPPWGSPAAAHRQPLPAPGPGAWKRAVRGQMGRAAGGLWTTEDPPAAAGPGATAGGADA